MARAGWRRWAWWAWGIWGVLGWVPVYGEWVDEAIGLVYWLNQTKPVVDTTTMPPGVQMKNGDTIETQWVLLHSGRVPFEWGSWSVAGYTRLQAEEGLTSVGVGITELKWSWHATEQWFVDVGVLRSKPATAYFMSPSRVLYEVQGTFRLSKTLYDQLYQGNIGISTDYFVGDATVWASVFPAVTPGSTWGRALPVALGMVGMGLTDGWGIAHQLIYFRQEGHGVGWNGSWQVSPEWTVYADTAWHETPTQWVNQLVVGGTYTQSKAFQVTLETYQNGNGVGGQTYDQTVQAMATQRALGQVMAINPLTARGPFGLGRYYQFGRLTWEPLPKWTLEWVGVVNWQDGSHLQSSTLQWEVGDHGSLQGTYWVLTGGDRSEFGMSPDKWGIRCQVTVY